MPNALTTDDCTSGANASKGTPHALASRSTWPSSATRWFEARPRPPRGTAPARRRAARTAAARACAPARRSADHRRPRPTSRAAARRPIVAGRKRLQRVQRADAHVGAHARASRERVDAQRAREVQHERAGLERRRDRSRAAASIARSGVATITSAAPRPGVGHERRLGAEARGGGRGGRRRRARGPRPRRRANRARAAPSAIVVPARPGPTSARVRVPATVPASMPRSSTRRRGGGSAKVTPASRTPSHVASASTRSGATSRSGASTNPRSHMRGCGIGEIGDRRCATSSTSNTSTSSVRGPHRSARSRVGERFDLLTRVRAARADRGSVSIATTAFRYASCGGPPTGAVS